MSYRRHAPGIPKDTESGYADSRAVDAGLLRRAGAFSISVLGDGQEAVARRFAAGHPPIVHWSGVDLIEGGHAPRLAGALGWIEARSIAAHDAGDHTFFIAAVESVERGPAPSALMYRDRSYHSL